MIVGVVSDGLSWEVVDGNFVLHSQIHRLFLVATAHIERHGLIEFALAFEVGS